MSLLADEHGASVTIHASAHPVEFKINRLCNITVQRRWEECARLAQHASVALGGFSERLGMIVRTPTHWSLCTFHTLWAICEQDYAERVSGSLNQMSFLSRGALFARRLVPIGLSQRRLWSSIAANEEIVRVFNSMFNESKPLDAEPPVTGKRSPISSWNVSDSLSRLVWNERAKIRSGLVLSHTSHHQGTRSGVRAARSNKFSASGRVGEAA